MGVGEGAYGGHITVTDHDVIEKSNLNRQFLFREHDLKKPKSSTAAASATSINPNLRVISHTHKVCPESEDIFSEDFFESLDVVVNALDNVAARLYVDGRCVSARRPLLESGTLGSKGHVQVIVPHLTESYSDSRDPPEKDVPFCTIRSFPNVIEHTIEWARDKFENTFFNKPQEFNKFLEDDCYFSQLRSSSSDKHTIARRLLKMLDKRPVTFEECLGIARRKFDHYFHHSILDLLLLFPHEKRNADGSLFWTPPKRPPTPIHFDPTDPLHLNFVQSAASVYASVYSIKLPSDSIPLMVLANLPSKEYTPKPVSEESTTDAAPEPPNATKPTDEKAFESAIYKLRRVRVSMRPQKKQRTDELADSPSSSSLLNPIQFEKDDDTNFHVDFVTAAANLRARNYGIQEADRLKVKLIAGKIIPAIATTTAAVAGLATLELIKVLKKLPLSAYKNAFLNLALPFVTCSEPVPAKRTILTPTLSVTSWDRWDVQSHKDMTLGDFISLLEQKHSIVAGCVMQDVHIVYMSMMPTHKKRLQQKLSSLIKMNKKKRYVDLVCSFTDKNDNEVTGPIVRVYSPA
mmetsp:Transcript_32453/g.54676  ORF Transcript_32453/g.54676 Transcript_32453/m.54676 type:complete len:576 (+) Transcript_32453:271-1998(+)